MLIAAVIPTYNRAGHLKLLLASLAAQTRHLEQIVVADDGSTDGTYDVTRRAAAAASDVTISHISLGPNGGMRAGRARNVGAANLDASVDVVIFLDPDLVLAPDAVERYAEAAGRWPGSVIMGTVAWMRDVESDRIRAALEEGDTDMLDAFVPNGAPERVEGTFVGPELREGFGEAAGVVHPMRAEWSVSLNYAWPRAAYTSIGGFNERMHGYGFDDMEIGMRAGAAGVTAVAAPDIRAWHQWHPKQSTAMVENQINLDYVLRRWPVSDVIADNVDWHSPVHYHADRGGTLRLDDGVAWVLSADRRHRLRLPDVRWIHRLGFMPAGPLTDKERADTTEEGEASEAWWQL